MFIVNINYWQKHGTCCLLQKAALMNALILLCGNCWLLIVHSKVLLSTDVLICSTFMYNSLSILKGILHSCKYNLVALMNYLTVHSTICYLLLIVALINYLTVHNTICYLLLIVVMMNYLTVHYTICYLLLMNYLTVTIQFAIYCW